MDFLRLGQLPGVGAADAIIHKVESRLDALRECGWIRAMRMKMLVVILGGLVVVAGCVGTVNDRHAFALSPGQDTFESRYRRPVNLVYDAAVDVVKSNGTISRETTISPGTNEVKAIEAQISERKVWVRVQAVDPEITSVKVQVRTGGGGKDLNLTQQLQNQIGIKLASR